MSIRNIASVFIIIIYAACRKSNYIPPVVPVSPVIPDSLLKWKEIGQIPGSSASDIFFNSPAKGFAAGDQIYRTNDSGRNWIGIPGTSSNQGNFFNLFFTDSQNGFAEGTSQMAFTNDGGDNWIIKPLASAWAYTLFFINSQVGFYGDQQGGGLYKTNDGGNTWKSIFKSSSATDKYYPHFLDLDTGFVMTESGMFESTTDGGQTWNFKCYVSNVSGGGSYSQLQFLNRNEGYFGGPTGVLKTTDGGQTWINELPATIISHVNYIKFFNDQSGYYKNATSIYYTVDGGGTWELSCSIGRGDFIIAMSFLDDHSGWACTNKGRVFRLQQ
jgi:photosystem II stability/assembly factor-like uncharacterized protein